MENQQAVALFIDYEYVVRGAKEARRQVPSPVSLINVALEHGWVAEARAFADFNDKVIEPYADQLVAGSINKIQSPVEVHNDGRVKNYTDFFMLDHIYQTAHTRPDIAVYILMTGDGHFGNVAAYLKHRLQKKVIVVGYEGSISQKFAQIGCSVNYFESEPKRSLTEDQVDKLIRFVYHGEKAQKIITASSTARYFKVPGFDDKSLLEEISHLAEEGIFCHREEPLDGKVIRRMYLNHENSRVMKVLEGIDGQ